MPISYDKASEAVQAIYSDAEIKAPEKIVLLEELKETIDNTIEQLKPKPRNKTKG